jgi:two-component system sensor histidine kinase DegS
MSLVERAHSLVAEVDADGPTVVVDIEERVPPRPAVAAELAGLLTEAFRNAVEHAGASVIEVTGRVGADGGTMSVTDNGRGFDPSSAKDDRYGLVGMKERAHLIGADLDVTSSPGRGTTVAVSWTGSS